MSPPLPRPSARLRRLRPTSASSQRPACSRPSPSPGPARRRRPPCQGRAPSTGPSCSTPGKFAYQRETARLQKERKLDVETANPTYARWLAAPMVAVAAQPPYAVSDWAWQIAVEKSADLRFWYLPGGNVFVSSAFFERGRFSASEIAALLAHGYAHEVAGHDAEEAALRLAAHADGKSPDPNRRLLVLAEILTTMGQRDPYQRVHERQADTIALDLLARAGHDPQGLVTLWKKLAVAALSANTGVVAVHPSWPERIAEIEAQLPAAMANYEKARAERARAEQARPAPRPRPAARPTQR
ncbi:MAG: M48 family metalloprotease [Betaproteobacteria bacterium]|nr:M48 family metalloprotease [Betaproteobacteria bacterium]